jgi:hypothetical protein
MLYHVGTFAAVGDDGRAYTVLAYAGQPNTAAPVAPER